jgi:hypothetical protein
MAKRQIGLWTGLIVVLLFGAVLAAEVGEKYLFPGNLDVPYVPTNQPAVEAMLRIAGVGPDDFVIDLGSGDGRILITAARQFGARGFGVDIDPERIRESKENAILAGISDRVRFVEQNLFETPIAQASVLTLYLLQRINLELRPRLLAELKPGTRVVSHDFNMGDWKPDATVQVRGVSSTIYYWVVPAKIEGSWRMQVEDKTYDLEIKQTYQEFDGIFAEPKDKPRRLLDTRLDGDRVRFLIYDEKDFFQRWRFEGRVAGEVMEGRAIGEGTAPRKAIAWRATRLPPP